MGAARDDRHAELNRRKWDARAPTYERFDYGYHRVFQRNLIRLIDPRPHIRFLDVGCGTGWAVRRVASLVGGQGQFHGLDLSWRMLAEAGLRARGAANVHFHQAQAEHLPFADGCFDCVICSFSFHHYLRPAVALHEMGRVLSAKGRIYIMEPTRDGPIICGIERWVSAREPEHVRFYSTDEYRRLVVEAGLRFVDTRLAWFPVKVHVMGGR
jgi:ubiquinone/menaquinone biosynthesis C-methylase UbiE